MSKIRKPPKFLLLLPLVLIISVITSHWKTGVLAQTELTAQFEYSMPDRFGMDRDSDGLIDYFTSKQQINPDKWQVDIDACASTGSPSEYATIEQTISPIVLDEITKWIKSQTK